MSLYTQDGWFGHRKDEYRQLCVDSNMYQSICPFGCTDLCNGLDVGVNKIFKQQMAHCFREHLSSEYERQHRLGTADSEIRYDFRLSNLKNRHLNWILSTYQYIVDRPQIVINSMQKALCLPYFNEQKERERYGIAS